MSDMTEPISLTRHQIRRMLYDALAKSKDVTAYVEYLCDIYRDPDDEPGTVEFSELDRREDDLLAILGTLWKRLVESDIYRPDRPPE